MIGAQRHQVKTQCRPASSVEEIKEYSTYFRGFPSKISFRVYLLASLGGKSAGFGSRTYFLIH